MKQYEESLYSDACFIVIAKAVKALAWLKKKKRKDDENRVLPCWRFATLAMLSGDVDILVGQGTIRKRQVGALKRVKPAPNGVIIV